MFTSKFCQSLIKHRSWDTLVLWHFCCASWTQWALVAREVPGAEFPVPAFGNGAGDKEGMGGPSTASATLATHLA